MSLIIAREIIRKLRSSGVKVYLGKWGEVCFSDIREVPAELKHKMMKHGTPIKTCLEEETIIHNARKKLRQKPALKDAPSTEL